MSHLWNRLNNSYYRRPKHCLGISFGQNCYWASHVSSDGQQRNVHWLSSEELQFPLFREKPSKDMVNILAESISKTCSKLENKNIPIQVAVPDPVCAASVFELDKLPYPGKKRDEFVRWRIAGELGLDGAGLACRHQVLERGENKFLMLGLAMDNAWLKCIKDAFRQAGAFASTIDMEASYRFNRFYDLCAQQGEGGAMVAIHSDFWSLLIWDDARRVRIVRSRWWGENSLDDPDMAAKEIAEEVELITRGYTSAGQGRQVDKVYITGAGKAMPLLEECLNQRMNGACIQIPVDNGVSTTNGNQRASKADLSQALSAAILR